MKAAAIALVALSFAAAGSAASAAASRATDLDYLRASRCKGLATALGTSETQGLDAYLKTESRSRDPMVIARGDYETHRAQQQVKDSTQKDKLSAELSNACTAYMNGGGSTATSR